MKINNYFEMEEKEVVMDGARDVTIRILIGLPEESNNIIMRLFKILPGGHTPKHTHNYEHVVKVVSGCGAVEDENGKIYEIKKGNAVFVKPNELHQFSNNSSEPFEFICVIPNIA